MRGGQKGGKLERKRLNFFYIKRRKLVKNTTKTHKNRLNEFCNMTLGVIEPNRENPLF